MLADTEDWPAPLCYDCYAKMKTIRVDLQMRTVSESNQRGSWRKHHKRRKLQRGNAMLCTRLALDGEKRKPAHIIMRRVAPRMLDQGNVAAALKYAQDGVADALEINDGDQSIAWQYEQRRSAVGEGYRVEVDIFWPDELRSVDG